MKIYPAIDICDKKVVRLLKGDYQKRTVYEKTPVQAAFEFESAGAKFLHVVDLDGAKAGELSNFESIREIADCTDMFIEVGGGIRTMERIEKYLSIGVGRVILGTAALENAKFLKEAVSEFGAAVAVGVDAAGGKVATRGWLNVSDTDSFEFCIRLCDMGVKNIIYTDISRDGALSGTNLDAYRRLSDISGLDITASGGITYYDEIEKLRDMNIYGAILGKAIYNGNLDLKKSLEIAGGQ